MVDNLLEQMAHQFLQFWAQMCAFFCAFKPFHNYTVLEKLTISFQPFQIEVLIYCDI